MNEYRQLLKDLQRAIDKALGPLEWDIHVADDGSELYLATGVDVANIDRERLAKNVNFVLYEYGFPEQPEPTGSPSGHLVVTAEDGAHAVVHILVKMGVDMWVELPAHLR